MLVICLGLVSLTLGVMFAGNLLVDLVPDSRAQELEYRRALSEALAGQYSKLAERGDSLTINFALQMLVERNEDVLSAALRRSDGTILAKAGEHEREWVPPPGEQSIFDHIQVPIFNGETPWGILQVTFRRAQGTGLWGVLAHPWIRFVVFVAAVGFLAYLLFMKKTLRQLDPSAVVPPRVKAALDVLAEGVVLLDTRGFIVLANAAFAERVGREPAALLGKALSELPWTSPPEEAAREAYPWTTAMQERKPQTGVRLLLGGPSEEVKNFLVNSAPIVDEGGTVRGVLTSFDDVTQLDHANAYLGEAVKDLEASRAEGVRGNAELRQQATRDPLTGCLNRQAFLAKVEAAFATARLEGAELSCILVDIDHFKSLNARYGHAVGDQAINAVARTVSATLRPTDFLGRYGDEEFCIIVPGKEAWEAVLVAEGVRQRIEAESASAIPPIPGVRITVSLGVSSTALGAPDPSKLIDQADTALYAAKEGGRNRVMCWDQTAAAQEPPSGTIPAGALSREALVKAGHPVGPHHA